MSTVHAATIARQAAPVLRVRACDYDFASGYLKQGIGVATGLQHSFSWQSVAASAVGAGVGQAVGPVFGEAFGNTAAGQFGARLATGLVAGTAAAVMRGGKIAVQQVATDAFANAIGSSLVDQSQPQPDNTQLATGDFARMDRELYNQQQWSAQSDAIQARRFAEIDTYKAASMGINDLPSDTCCKARRRRRSKRADSRSSKACVMRRLRR